MASKDFVRTGIKMETGKEAFLNVKIIYRHQSSLVISTYNSHACMAAAAFHWPQCLERNYPDFKLKDVSDLFSSRFHTNLIKALYFLAKNINKNLYKGNIFLFKRLIFLFYHFISNALLSIHFNIILMHNIQKVEDNHHVIF